MRHAQSLGQEAELFQMPDQARAIACPRDRALRAGFHQMRLQGDSVVAREICAVDQERIGAVQRNGWPQRGSYLAAVELPVRENVPAGGECLFDRRGVQRGILCTQVLRQRVEQAGQRLIDGVRSAIIGATTARMPASR